MLSCRCCKVHDFIIVNDLPHARIVSTQLMLFMWLIVVYAIECVVFEWYLNSSTYHLKIFRIRMIILWSSHPKHKFYTNQLKRILCLDLCTTFIPVQLIWCIRSWRVIRVGTLMSLSNKHHRFHGRICQDMIEKKEIVTRMLATVTDQEVTLLKFASVRFS